MSPYKELGSEIVDGFRAYLHNRQELDETEPEDDVWSRTEQLTAFLARAGIVRWSGGACGDEMRTLSAPPGHRLRWGLPSSLRTAAEAGSSGLALVIDSRPYTPDVPARTFVQDRQSGKFGMFAVDRTGAARFDFSEPQHVLVTDIERRLCDLFLPASAKLVYARLAPERLGFTLEQITAPAAAAA